MSVMISQFEKPCDPQREHLDANFDIVSPNSDTVCEVPYAANQRLDSYSCLLVLKAQ